MLGTAEVSKLASADGSASAADGAVIRCAGLTKVFRDFWMRNRVRAVDGLDLEVRRGEVYGLLGPNGSGKSTTIKMILGLLHPTAGRVALLGKRPHDVATKRLVGYLPEESYLYRFLNARETLDYYGRLFHLDPRSRARRIDMLLEMVGLDAVQRRPVGEYSKGMQRRIGLAQALINDPQVLILDEPTTGLDPIGTRQIKDLIVQLAQRGKTVLLCSHLLADVEDVCDRISIMFGGKIRLEGRVDDLLVQQDMTSLEVQKLDDQTIHQIEQLLAQSGRHIERVDRPRQRLESLFLEIVHRAQVEGAATSGATAGGPVAQFLIDEQRGAHLPDGVDAAKVIEQLVADRPIQRPAAAPSRQGSTGQDDAMLEKLTRRAEDKGVDRNRVAVREPTSAEKVDRSVIDRLTGDSCDAQADRRSDRKE